MGNTTFIEGPTIHALVYINAQSNHTPHIINQLPKALSSRIFSLACNASEFDKAATLYNEALRTSGFTQQLNYVDVNKNPKSVKKKIDLARLHGLTHRSAKTFRRKWIKHSST